MSVKVQTTDFDVGAEIAAMRLNSANIGALVSFVGQVRDFNDGDNVTSMFLEHYPGMTEKVLSEIIAQAKARWSIADATIIHRVGELKAQDQIVLVLVASAHRQDAFAACEFMMDHLKTNAPFWKKNRLNMGFDGLKRNLLMRLPVSAGSPIQKIID
jgi:molybdopterin synthase catalytic subunit